MQNSMLDYEKNFPITFIVTSLPTLPPIDNTAPPGGENRKIISLNLGEVAEEDEHVVMMTGG